VTYIDVFVMPWVDHIPLGILITLAANDNGWKR